MEKEASTGELRAALARKINDIQKAIRGMKPDGFNSHQNYHYFSAQQIREKLSELLPEHGLAIVPSEISLQVAEIGQTKSGNAQFSAETCIEYRLIDTATGFFETCLFSGHAVDTGHKQVSKAKTECHKRFIGQLFNIAESDGDPDSETNTTAGTSEPGKGAKAMAEKYPKFAGLPGDIKALYREKNYQWASGDEHAMNCEYDPERIQESLANK